MAHYASEPLAKYMHAPRLRTTCAHVCVKSYKVATESTSDPEQLTALLATHGYAETLLYSALHPDPTYLLGLSDGRDADRATSTIVHMVRWHSRRTVITERFTAPEKLVLTVLYDFENSGSSSSQRCRATKQSYEQKADSLESCRLACSTGKVSRFEVNCLVRPRPRNDHSMAQRHRGGRSRSTPSLGRRSWRARRRLIVAKTQNTEEEWEA